MPTAMRKWLFTIARLFLVLLVFSFVFMSAQANRSKWKLVWSDEFNEKGYLDTTVWSKIPRGAVHWKRYMSDYDSCYAVKDGNLVLRGILNETLKNDTAPYITGGVCTKGKNLFNGTGRLEIKAQIRGIQGAWPAIWMVAENTPWPHGGEIDIMENTNNRATIEQTVHSYYTYTLKQKSPIQTNAYKIVPGSYNIYAVEFYPDSLCFYVNGKHTLTYPRINTDLEGQFPFYQPYYLMLDMQFTSKVKKEDLPAEMWVDWVKYYKKEE